MNTAAIFTTSRVTAAVALALIALAIYSILSPEAPKREPLPRTRSAEVKRVISGHRIKIEPDDSVVYAGIRAPYLHKPLGDDALQLNRRLASLPAIRDTDFSAHSACVRRTLCSGITGAQLLRVAGRSRPTDCGRWLHEVRRTSCIGDSGARLIRVTEVA